MKLFFRIERNLRVSLLVILITLFAFLSSIFCFYINLIEVPLGFALGGLVVSFLYLLGHFMYQLDIKNGTAKFSIISISLRNIILIGTIILLGFLYYYWNIKLFNIFAFIGIYTVGMIIFVLDHVIVFKD